MSRRADSNYASVSPAGQQSIRRQNLALVFQEVVDNGPRSRAGIAAAVGLTRSTVSSLVQELIDRGLLLEQELQRAGTVGRPGRLVALSGATVAALGLEINVDYLAACVLDLTGKVRYERLLRHENRDMPAESVIDALVELGSRALEAAEGEGLVSVGTTLALPGLVDVATGTLLRAPNLGWERLSLADGIAGRLGDPIDCVAVENEANLAAQAEFLLGGGREWGDFFRISGEIGVGGAMVVDGQLLRSGSGLGGELGHVTIDPEGPPCSCGSRGCLEQFVGQEALLRSAGVKVEVGTSIALPDGGISLVVKGAEQGDPRTLATLDSAGHALGLACAAVVNLFSPDTVVLGGIYAPLFPWLGGPLREELERRAFLTRYSKVAVTRSMLGSPAAVRGAASRALRAVRVDPTLVG